MYILMRLLSRKIFPMYAKDTAMALGVALNWIANWLVAFSFPHIQVKEKMLVDLV